jgi:long-chain acyl-CoA synthetase
MSTAPRPGLAELDARTFTARDAATLCETFQRTAARHADFVALRTPDDAVLITWAEYADRVRRIAAGLAALGVGVGDTVAIMLVNRPEFNLVDTAALHLGATPFSVYNSSTAEQLSYLLRNAANRTVVTEQSFLPVIGEAIAATGNTIDVVLVDGDHDRGATLAELETIGDPGFDFEATWRRVVPGFLSSGSSADSISSSQTSLIKRSFPLL